MVTQMQTDIKPVNWDSFLQRFDWQQGEHIGLIGPTGSGKTTLSLELMSRRKYVCIIGTEPEDDTLSKFAKQHDYKIIREFPQYFDPVTHSRLVLWPKMKRMSDQGTQRMAVGHALQTMFTQKRWAINVDELSYISKDLNLEPHLKLIWQQGRSIGISLVAGTQRPAHVPLLIYDQSTHLFFWHDNDEANLRRIGGLGSLNSRLIRDTVAALPENVFLYLNTRTSEMLISKANIKKGK
jgi:hypothetical protein